MLWTDGALTPLPREEAADRTAHALERLGEFFGADIPPSILRAARVPAFLQDFALNFRKFVMTAGSLDLKTKALVGWVVAGAHSTQWRAFFLQRCESLGWTQQQIADALAVAATCAQYNAFFKFRDNAGSDLFQGMAVGLRAHTFQNSQLDDQTVELLCVVVSNRNACRTCTAGHVAKARQLGVSDEAILESVQCAATLAGVLEFDRTAAPD